MRGRFSWLSVDTVEWTGTTGAEEVLATIDWLERQGITYQINGGWAVDALIGRQTRTHRDLDVFVDAAMVPGLVDELERRGYVVAEDWAPVRVELVGSRGCMDVHPMVLRAEGDGVQSGLDGGEFIHAAKDRTTGTIHGRTVVVANAERLRELRSGYELRAEDRHDLLLLENLIDHG
jgi:lincosamide nucleotidyltransferase A/C/D/E